MAKSNWDKMKERFDKNCPFTPEFIESSKEFRRRYEAGEFNTGNGGFTTTPENIYTELGDKCCSKEQYEKLLNKEL